MTLILLIGFAVQMIIALAGFAPEIAANSDFEENFHRRGRGQKRGQVR